MPTELSSLLVFLAAVALGGYLQAFIGFALGMFVMGAVTALHVAPIAVTATALNFMALPNALVVLHKTWRSVDYRNITPTLVGLLPATVAGVLLLETIGARSATSLRFLLAAVIVAGGVALFVRPHPSERRSRPASFATAGALSGLLGGLFSIPSPPLVYHYYRQPLGVGGIRSALVLVFAIVAVVRLVTVSLRGQLEPAALSMGLLSVPVALAFGWLAVHFPPRISDVATRRWAFLLLTLLGVSTAAVALLPPSS